MFIFIVIKKLLPQRFGYSVVGVRESVVPALLASSSREGLIRGALKSSCIEYSRQITVCTLQKIKEYALKINLIQKNIDVNANIRLNKIQNSIINYNCAEDARNLSP